MTENNVPKVFISYSWESKEHSDWVKFLADKLLADGVEAIIDSYDVSPGDRLPKFMESSIRDSDYVIIICTEEYKRKANNREKGVGYESHIISAELYNNHNDRKFIPIIRQGDFNTALPTYLNGKFAIDLRGNPFNENSYKDLIASIFKVKKKPNVGIRPYYLDEYEPISIEGEDIKIVGIITNEVTLPRNDGTRGSALYSIPFRLSRKPTNTWSELFVYNWNHPPRFTTMHRPGIASVHLDKIILNGTTVEEVKKYHRDTLVLCVEKTNEEEKQIRRREEQLKRKKQEEIENHYRNINDISKDIKF
ncbi:toll/interleukin-1 receptor domain-containing protein [uncultured Peptoniphilus sp.]|uniref:toll/interleukin-1 receptor domain-containing protein n=1 Tax=uncultured Peptoniphilus sp. TaxID=254354 RepID=UPI0025E959A4|nr:toll/interleukin-1 receptor domain-containing protein [uncultured Peptoniphilus sp.]